MAHRSEARLVNSALPTWGLYGGLRPMLGRSLGWLFFPLMVPRTSIHRRQEACIQGPSDPGGFGYQSGGQPWALCVATGQGAPQAVGEADR